MLNAKQKFEFIIKNYPNTDFALDAEYKLNLIQDFLASKEMYIAYHYIKKKKWIPAINRYKTVLKDYETTIFVEEALHRLVELHYNLGLIEESQKYASILGYNYQSSIWYEKSYKVFNSDYKTKLEIKKRKRRNFLKNSKDFLIKMKEKNSVHENYKNKIKLYKSYSRSYYINSKPLVSDKIFDDLKKEILKIEKDYGFDDKELHQS